MILSAFAKTHVSPASCIVDDVIVVFSCGPLLMFTFSVISTIIIIVIIICRIRPLAVHIERNYQQEENVSHENQEKPLCSMLLWNRVAYATSQNTVCEHCLCTITIHAAIDISTIYTYNTHITYFVLENVDKFEHFTVFIVDLNIYSTN